MWPNKVADGNWKTSTPGILSDLKETEIDESIGLNNRSGGGLNVDEPSSSLEEFPILDELDRLAKVGQS
jgi:hypothetical protein